jgi:hypothetical protein
MQKKITPIADLFAGKKALHALRERLERAFLHEKDVRGLFRRAGWKKRGDLWGKLLVKKI